MNEIKTVVVFKLDQSALGDVKVGMYATVPLTRNGQEVGYGVSKVDKAIACDTAIAILRQIKAIKAW